MPVPFLILSMPQSLASLASSLGPLGLDKNSPLSLSPPPHFSHDPLISRSCALPALSSLPCHASRSGRAPTLTLASNYFSPPPLLISPDRLMFTHLFWLTLAPPDDEGGRHDPWHPTAIVGPHH